MYQSLYKLMTNTYKAAVSLHNRNELHRDIQRLMGESREENKTVFRVFDTNNGEYLLLYSERKPANPCGQMPWMCEEPIPQQNVPADGAFIAFDVVVTPIRNGLDANGKKKKYYLGDSAKRLDWLGEKAEAGGFRILTADEVGQQRFDMKKGNSHTFWAKAYEYRGIAQITDRRLFEHCLTNGLGGNACYGAGLILFEEIDSEVSPC